MEHPAAEVRLVMECLGGDWVSLDGRRRCLYRGAVRLTQSSLVEPGRAPRVLETMVEWEQSTPDMFMPPVVPVEEEEPVEVPMTASKEEMVNGPAWTSSPMSVSDGSGSGHEWRGWFDFRSLPGRTDTTDLSDSSSFVGGSSTAFSAVRDGAGLASEPSSSSAMSVGSSSVGTPSTSGPSEGGVHG